MIGRLVKKKNPRFSKQNLSKFNPHIPSLGKSLRIPAEFFFLESKSKKCPSGLNFRRFAVAHLKSVIEASKFFNQLGI